MFTNALPGFGSGGAFTASARSGIGRSAPAQADPGFPGQKQAGLLDALPDEQKRKILDDQDVAAMLNRAAEQQGNASRSEKISRVKERIEQLKEKLKFATPAQAKQLMKELKQLAKEFKQAATSLNQNGAGLQAQGPVSNTQSAQALSATTSASGAVTAVQSPLTANTAETTQAEAIAAQTTTASPEYSAGQEDGSTAAADSGQTDGFTVQDVISAYGKTVQTEADQQQNIQSDDVLNKSIKNDHYDELRKLQKELETLADRIKSLAERGDKSAEKEFEKVKRELEAADRELDTFASNRLSAENAAGTGQNASAAPQQPSLSSGIQGVDTLSSQPLPATVTAPLAVTVSVDVRI